jgi:hypothetical protein
MLESGMYWVLKRDYKKINWEMTSITAAFSDVISFFDCFAGWEVHCGIYKSSYNVSNISYLNSPPPPCSFLLPSSHSWNSFNKCHFLFTYTYTQYLYQIHLSTPFPHLFSPPTSTVPHAETGCIPPSCFPNL